MSKSSVPSVTFTSLPPVFKARPVVPTEQATKSVGEAGAELSQIVPLLVNTFPEVHGVTSTI